MTEHGHNFIREIAEAYRALETEPELHRQIKALEHSLEHALQHVQSLELRAIDRKVEMDELQAKVRSLEVERDDASFRQLEAEDKVATLKHLVGSFQTTVGDTLKAMEPPPPPEPPVEVTVSVIVEPEPLADTSPGFAGMVGERVMDPTPPAAIEVTGTFTSALGPDVSTEPAPVIEAQEVPQPLPTVSAESTPSLPASSTDASNETSASSPASQPEVLATPEALAQGKYVGKRYHEWPYYVSFSAWMAGGGTEDDYWWKPVASSF